MQLINLCCRLAISDLPHRARAKLAVCWQLYQSTEFPMYIGLGTIVLILILVLLFR